MGEEEKQTTQDRSEPGWLKIVSGLGFLMIVGMAAWFLFPWIGWWRKRRTKREASERGPAEK